MRYKLSNNNVARGAFQVTIYEFYGKRRMKIGNDYDESFESSISDDRLMALSLEWFLNSLPGSVRIEDSFGTCDVRITRVDEGYDVEIQSKGSEKYSASFDGVPTYDTALHIAVHMVRICEHLPMKPY